NAMPSAICSGGRPTTVADRVSAVNQPVVPAVANAPNTAAATMPRYCPTDSVMPEMLAMKMTPMAGKAAAQPSIFVVLPSGTANPAYAGGTPRLTAVCLVSGSVAPEDWDANANCSVVHALPKNRAGETLPTKRSRIG